MFQLWGKLAENWLGESSEIHTNILTSNLTKNIIMASAHKKYLHNHKAFMSAKKIFLCPVLCFVSKPGLVQFSSLEFVFFNGDLAILFGGFLSIATAQLGDIQPATTFGKYFYREKYSMYEGNI